MLPHEIVSRRRKCPAAFIGVGTLEWHGEHLAVGNDALKADKLCELAAGRCGGFAMPTLWYGEPRNTGLMQVVAEDRDLIRKKMKLKKKKMSPEYFGDTPEEHIEFFQKLISHMLIQMNTLEMKAVCLLCGHYPLAHWAKEPVNEFNRSFPDTQAFVGSEHHYPTKSNHVGGDHAAKWETSYLWYLRPDCVDMGVFKGREDESLIGVRGIDPRQEASIEVGRKGSDLIVNAMVRKANDLIARASR